MKTVLKKYHYNFPLYFYCYEPDSGNLLLTFLNEKKRHVSQVTVEINQEICTFDLNTNEQVISVKKDNYDDNLVSKPTLISCMVDDVIYELKDYPDFLFIEEPKSIFTLGWERFLYVQKTAKALNKPTSSIKTIAFQNEYYWACTCGHNNFASAPTCLNCGNEKKRLFGTDLSVDREAIFTEYELRLNNSILIFTALTFVIQLVYQIIYGDFLFPNFTKNDAFGVFNRFIVPFLIIGSTIGILIVKIRYMERLTKLFRVIRMAGILYLNLFSATLFVLTAYDLLFVLALDVMIGAVVLSKWKNKHIKPDDLFLAGITLLLLSITIVNWTQFASYNMSIHPEGIALHVETKETDYTIPEKINNIPVFQVLFDTEYDYEITSLTISKNVQSIAIYSTAVLPHLATVSIKTGNTHYMVIDNVLYEADGSVKLLPMVFEEIYIDSETIAKGALRDSLNLKHVTIGPHVKTIEAEAFINNISLETITFEAGGVLETIGAQAFYNCQSLTSVELPITLNKMGLGVFEGCNSLESLTMPFLGEEREPTDDLLSSNDTISYTFGSRTYSHTYLLPTTLTYVEIYDIDRIHNVTFYGAAHLEEIVLSGTFVSMGIACFYGCQSLQDFTIPTGVEIIYSSSFENCYNLDNLVIPATVISIQANAFLNANLGTVTYLGNLSNLVIDPVGNDALLTALGLD